MVHPPKGWIICKCFNFNLLLLYISVRMSRAHRCSFMLTDCTEQYNHCMKRVVVELHTLVVPRMYNHAYPPPSTAPVKVALVVDGKTDVCSQGEDINFDLLGFSIHGQVSLLPHLLVGIQHGVVLVSLHRAWCGFDTARLEGIEHGVVLTHAP